jgi:hypothetical protein
VSVADEELAKLIMMNPQDGGPALGQAWLREHKLPHMRSDNSRLFLIDMANDMANDHADASDAAAHTGKMTTLEQESVRHAQIRGSIFKYLINAETEKRQSTSDPVIQRLYANLRKEVHSGRSSSEWGESKAGLAGFILRYLHYALFALDLTDEQFEQLWLLYYTPGRAREPPRARRVEPSAGFGCGGVSSPPLGTPPPLARAAAAAAAAIAPSLWTSLCVFAPHVRAQRASAPRRSSSRCSGTSATSSSRSRATRT